MDEVAADGVSMAQYIDEMMEERELSDKEVALRLGYNTPNLIRMFRQGRMKVPLDLVPALADAIGANRSKLMDRALHEYLPATIRALILCHSGLTDNELALVSFIRKISNDADPSIDDEHIRSGLERLFVKPSPIPQ